MNSPSDVPHEVEVSLAALWCLPPTHHVNFFERPEFRRFQNAFRSAYPHAAKGITLGLALHDALRSLGAPCLVPVGPQAVPGNLSPSEAAATLHRAVTATQATWTYACPLDLAADLAPIRFGSARVLPRGRVDELAEVLQWERLGRHYPKPKKELRDLAQFQWLIVHDDKAVPPAAGARGYSTFDEIFARAEPARIVPHSTSLPRPVEDALAFMLTAPWEDWSTLQTIDWRAFRLPWVQVACSDIFVKPTNLPESSSLNWETRAYWNGNEDEEWEAPIEMDLNDKAKHVSELLSEERWQEHRSALSSHLFETPVSHFLVRAYLSDGIDEFLAHMMLIDAAIGTKDDFVPSRRAKKGGPGGAKARMDSRIATLLDYSAEAETFSDLFEIRSTYVHGRTLEEIVPADRVAARRLARLVTCGLVQRSIDGQAAANREDFLDMLLDESPSVKNVSAK